MDPLSSEALSARDLERTYRAETRRLVARAAPTAVTMLIGFGITSGFVEAFYFPERRAALAVLNFFYISLCFSMLLFIRSFPSWTLPATVSTANTIQFCVTGYFAWVGGNAELCVLVLASVLAGLVIINPWGFRMQLLASGGALFGYPLALYAGAVPALPPSYGVFALITISTLTMFGARLLDRHRFAAYRHAAEIERANAILSHEKEFSATLVQVGRTLNATIGDPESLARQLTEHVRQVLSADWSVLFRRRRDEKIFQLAGGSGVPSEIMDELSTLGLSPRFLPFFYEALSREGTIQVVDFQRQDLVPSSLLERWGVTGFVSQGVRRDDRIIGILTSCYTKPRAPLSPREKRLLEGIANQAAVALENAGLVEAVRAADRAKSEFVATMSHELRTPLNVILGYVDLILDGTFGRPAAEEADVLNRIRHQSTELLDLIQGMLDVNRLEVRGLQLNLCEFSLGDLMEGIRGAIPRGWYKPAVRVEWEVRNERTLLRSDRTKLEMMLRNLIHNALKYTEQGTITVRAQIEPTDRFVRFEVADTGPGIAPEDLSKIFEMFGQVSARPAVGGGVGLGLYIVKRLTEALGGHVGVESLLGSGSCFTVLLPAEAPPQRAVT